MAANGNAQLAPSPKSLNSLKESHKTVQQRKAMMSFRSDADLESNIKDQAAKVRPLPSLGTVPPGVHQGPPKLSGASLLKC